MQLYCYRHLQDIHHKTAQCNYVELETNNDNLQEFTMQIAPPQVDVLRDASAADKQIVLPTLETI